MPARSSLVRLALLALALSAPPLLAKKPPQPAADTPAQGPKSRAEVLEGTTAIPGLIPFHRSADKLFLELPTELVDAPLGFSATLVRAVGDFVPRGSAIETELVRWTKVGDRLVLAKETTDFRAAAGTGFDVAVRESFPRSPVFSAPLVALSDRPAPLLVDAGKLFGPALAEILPPRSGATPDPEGTILESVRGFADNVVARVRFRFQLARGGDRGGGDENPFQRYQRPSRLADPRGFEVTVDFHFYRLPEDGYRPRFADDRIGAFTRDYKDYTGVDDRDTAFRHVVTRFDLRKKDPAAALSEPVEPIVFTMDRSIPEEWRPLVREGALWWNAAFEKAGFKNAIEIRDPPDDPSWDPADLHVNAIYWNLTDDLVFSGLAGPMFSDPRTGQTLKANVYLNAEFFSFSRHRYLVYAWWRAPEPAAGTVSASRPSVDRRDPFLCDRQASFSSQMAFARLVLGARGVLRPGTPEADRFAREAFLELASHEVGHALGFPHNWKASLVASWEDVRDNKVSGRQGHNPFSTSVMDYAPTHLSPKGEPQGDYFLHGVGAYDDLQVEYIYKSFASLSPADEARELDRIAAKAETERGLIYDGGELNAIDPTTNADDLGDDPLSFAASRLALIHDEVLPGLPKLVLDEGHDFNHLRAALDSAIFSVALDYVDMIARQVGGQVLLRRVATSPASPEGGDPPIVPISAAEQRRALETLDRHLFAEGLFALSPETMALLKPDLQFDWNYPWRFASDYDLGRRIEGLYEAALATLFDPQRLARVRDNERRVPAGEALTLPDLFAHLEATAFGGAGGRVGPDRRALQRRLVDHLARLALEPAPGAPPEAAQVAAWSLRSIAKRLERAKGDDAYTEAHYGDLQARVKRVLEARVTLPG